VHLGIPALLKFYREHRENDALVLATIIGTNGSTYRKPGAMMLISRDGAFEGMISGGCLESDLLQHAADVFSHGQPRHITYDMHADEDLVWDLGLGCDGVIHLLLQRLDWSLNRQEHPQRVILRCSMNMIYQLDQVLCWTYYATQQKSGPNGARNSSG
jgi:xanthine/CO dehydrogenase XdhC/CoxF family maturation factor